MANNGSNFLVRVNPKGEVTDILVQGYSLARMVMKGKHLSDKRNLTNLKSKAVSRKQHCPTVKFVKYGILLDMPKGEDKLDEAGI